ncbi:hypothetical protein ACFVAV_01525 [Nocardia sp. NPDC057663]|uniref:hypothetical protein n=1 Tax=Nocardia sp. NPDC057663 TaxID=3346201 RepID=UPI00366CB103
MSNEALGILMVAVMVGFACGIIAGVIAAKKNRSQGAFFLLGFFFGPLGVLATALVGSGAPSAPAGMRAVTALAAPPGRTSTITPPSSSAGSAKRL